MLYCAFRRSINMKNSFPFTCTVYLALKRNTHILVGGGKIQMLKLVNNYKG